MSYYEPKDLADFPNITEWAQKEGNKFFEYYGAATGAGKLTEREKSLIALTVAITQNCPYCIDAYTTKCHFPWHFQRRNDGSRPYRCCHDGGRDSGAFHADAKNHQEKGNVMMDAREQLRILGQIGDIPSLAKKIREINMFTAMREGNRYFTD